MTGGSGVVGRAVVRRLVEDGRRVKGLARSRAAAEALHALGAEPVVGDVLQPESLDNLEGCEAVFHVAGVNRFCLKDPSSMVRTNVEGTANVVQAAARGGVARIVYTSSAVTLGEAEGTVGDESCQHRGSFLSAYERSKFEAERLATELADRHGVELVSLNPSSVQGPGRATGTGQLLVRYLQGRLSVRVDTTVSLVDIDDCAQAHLLAMTKGAPGERYVLNAASLPTADLLTLMDRVAPRQGRPRLVPRPLAVAATTLMEQRLVYMVGRRSSAGSPCARSSTVTATTGRKPSGSSDWCIGRSRRPSGGQPRGWCLKGWSRPFLGRPEPDTRRRAKGDKTGVAPSRARRHQQLRQFRGEAWLVSAIRIPRPMAGVRGLGVAGGSDAVGRPRSLPALRRRNGLSASPRCPICTGSCSAT